MIVSVSRPLALAAGLLVAALPAADAAAQSRQIPAPPQQRPVVIHSGTVHPVDGPPIEGGYVVFARGVVSDVGAGTAPDLPGAFEFDAAGLHVYPGLIAATTTLGLVETGSVDDTIDHSEHGRYTPEVRAAVAINPDSDHIPVARASGILTALTMPQGGLVSGRCSTIRLDGWTWEDLAIDAEAGIVVSWPRTEPISAWWMDKSEADQRKEIREDLQNIERLFDEAEAYLRARDVDPDLPTDLRHEAMRPALQGEKPVFVRAASAGQIESAVAWAERRGLRIVIVNGNQADRVIPLLLKHDVPVIVGGTHRLPGRRDEAYDAPYALPASLHAAGVRFCISGRARPGSERNLHHNAATAAAYGLPPDAALRAVTIDAARILGLGDSHGTIARGRAATLIVTTGDPLEITTDVLLAFIDGRRIDLGNRQKTLYAKYQEKYRQLGLIE
ncbi:MAG: amidohydrolase family protein [Planctomycetota bacterium]|jgi:imidazolonepropionase-like amidohydrolase